MHISDWSSDVCSSDLHILGVFNPVFLVANIAAGGIISDVSGKRGLAHARTTGQDHKIAVMQATDLIIQTREACGDDRQMPAAGKCALGNLYRPGAGLKEAFDPPSLPLPLGKAQKPH